MFAFGVFFDQRQRVGDFAVRIDPTYNRVVKDRSDIDSFVRVPVLNGDF